MPWGAVMQENRELKERVQKLEKDKTEMYKLNQKLGAKAWEIEQQNKRYREALQVISDVEHIVKCLDEEIVQVARKALEGEE